MDLPAILDAGHVDDAAGLLRRYYTQKLTSGHVRTGARFDTWAGGGDSPGAADRITADDLVALALLGEEIKGPAVVGLLETKAPEIGELLELIPVSLELADVTGVEYVHVLGKDSPAWLLWEIFRGYRGGQWKMGPTKTSKLLARKRPKLIPIWDSMVARSIGAGTSLTQWEEWHALLTANDRELVRLLDEVQDRAALPVRVSALRAMDVVLWMDAKQRGFRAAPGDDD
ncbi:DUF6308 family protein [Arthrobacter jinronghuae]|uniref:DUF6308 family protein n=1 Tax=Arthrobacter jinronghuae TaxID=2964609 RepID=A0ABT1NMK1_9MICC|nr:DUF6308 family protein [Arthrobacter jinronghuae]MCQ1948943.1 DUF6308 family protein [Arthrobacter jinronghuae]MCQ1952269.1 DUF6308 family protein [Arthrobacter sp. zg-Y238]UWX78254.1 DUF6308 family protein [Arthrobacter jinronghuae]